MERDQLNGQGAPPPAQERAPQRAASPERAQMARATPHEPTANNLAEGCYVFHCRKSVLGGTLADQRWDSHEVCRDEYSGSNHRPHHKRCCANYKINIFLWLKRLKLFLTNSHFGLDACLHFSFGCLFLRQTLPTSINHYRPCMVTQVLSPWSISTSRIKHR